MRGPRFFGAQMSKLKHPLFELLRSDGHISVNKALMFALGNDEAMIYAELLSRHAYFAERDELNELEYFYNTVDDLRGAVNLNSHYQRTAINNLVDIGLIKMHLHGLPAKRFFRIENNPNLLLELLQLGKEKARNLPKSHSYQNREHLAVNEVNGKKGTNTDEPLSDETQAKMNDLGALTAMGQLLKGNGKRARH